jgi:hypothetical protein
MKLKGKTDGKGSSAITEPTGTAQGRNDRLPTLVAELVRRQVFSDRCTGKHNGRLHMNDVSSAGLRSFVTLAKHAHSNNRIVALGGMSGEVVQIFEISGLLLRLTTPWRLQRLHCPGSSEVARLYQ